MTDGDVGELQAPPIRQATSVLLLNDLINSNLRPGKSEHDAAIAQSGLIQRSVAMVAEARKRNIPIIWIRVERRADRTDVVNAITDRSIANGLKTGKVVTCGSFEAQNVDELPVLENDHEILKPRRNPFIGTDLELRLRSMGVDTILLGGYSTTGGVESAARTALDLNFNVVVLHDCCYHVKEDLHVWAITRTLPLFSRVMSSAQALDILG